MIISLNWLKEYVKVKGSAEEVAHRLTMAGLEVKSVTKLDSPDDIVFEAEITSNRPDWLSMLGVSREVSALYNSALLVPKITIPLKRDSALRVPVHIQNLPLCPYYSAVVLQDVSFGESPDFMKERLMACSLRPINFVVDVTNYVLLECGQPLHAFDLERIEGREIIVRSARKGEQFLAINEKKYDLEEGDIVIADRSRPIALGGVMGGKETEVSSATKHILLESAFFNPVSVRRTSRRLALTSESSYRFERRVDPKGVEWGRDRAISLLCQYGRVGKVGVVSAGGKLKTEARTIVLASDEVRRTLGVDVAANTVRSILTNLGCGVKASSKKAMRVSVPSFRADLKQGVDLVEEVARIWGYDRVAETLPEMQMSYPAPSRGLVLERRLREILPQAGLREIITFSLVKEEVYQRIGFDLNPAVRIINPRNKELCLLRPSMLCSMLGVIQQNLARRNTDLALFEIGRVYRQERGDLPNEGRRLCVALSGYKYFNWLDHKREFSLFDAKGLLIHLVRALSLGEIAFKNDSHPFFSAQSLSVWPTRATHRVAPTPAGWLGELHPQLAEYYGIEQPVFLAELDLDELARISPEIPSYHDISRYPAVRRDIAIVVDEKIKAEEVEAVIREAGSSLLKTVELFDVYRGKSIPKGQKSLAYELEFRSDERTLSTEEVNQLHQAIVERLSQRLGARLR